MNDTVIVETGSSPIGTSNGRDCNRNSAGLFWELQPALIDRAGVATHRSSEVSPMVWIAAGLFIGGPGTESQYGFSQRAKVFAHTLLPTSGPAVVEVGVRD